MDPSRAAADPGHLHSDLIREEPDYREFLDSDTAEAVAEIEQEAGLSLKFRDADVGRGASGCGAAVEIIGAIAVVGGASAAVEQAARLVKWAYHKIASTTGGRPWVSLGAAEYLAVADLIDRVGSEALVLGSGDMNSNRPDRAFTGGDAFLVVLATEPELPHYHVSAYGEVHYIGSSPPICHHWNDPPPWRWSRQRLTHSVPPDSPSVAAMTAGQSGSKLQGALLMRATGAP